MGGAVWVLLPHRFAFAFRGEVLLAEDDAGRLRDMDHAYRVACAWIEPEMRANRDKLTSLAGWFTLSCVLLACEVVLWTIRVVV